MINLRHLRTAVVAGLTAFGFNASAIGLCPDLPGPGRAYTSVTYEAANYKCEYTVLNPGQPIAPTKHKNGAKNISVLVESYYERAKGEVSYGVTGLKRNTDVNGLDRFVIKSAVGTSLTANGYSLTKYSLNGQYRDYAGPEVYRRPGDTYQYLSLCHTRTADGLQTIRFIDHNASQNLFSPYFSMMIPAGNTGKMYIYSHSGGQSHSVFACSQVP